MIRKTLWANQAEAKAENVVKKKIQQWNKENAGVTGVEKPNRDELMLKAKGKAYLKSSLDEYPNYWITWLAMGPPADNPSPVMLTNQILKRNISSDVVPVGEELFSRSKRRIHNLKAQQTSVTTKSSTSSSASRFQTPQSMSSVTTGNSFNNTDELVQHRREMQTITDSIKDYFMIHGNDVDDDVIKRLKEVHREVQRKYLKYMENKLNIDPTDIIIVSSSSSR